MRRWSTGITGAALAACVAIAAGCGSSKGPQVAQIGTTTTPNSTSSSSSASSTSSSASPAAFSECMRKHGVTNFPDPDSQGRILIQGGRNRNGQAFGLDPGSPTFRKAQQACQKLSPKFGHPPSAQELARAKQQALAFSACMRSHGVPKFPDPTFSGGGTKLSIGPNVGVDPGSPAFRKAQQTCQKLVPGGPITAGPAPRS